MIEILNQNKELWDLFTRREEYNSPILDQYDRFPYYLSKHRNILEPELSKFLIKNGLKVEYPEGKRFAVCLTHDIDTVYLYTSKLSIIYNAAKSLKERQFRNAFEILFSKIKKWSPLWNFKDIMALEEKYGAKSSFFFITSDKDINKINYDIKDVANELGRILDSGWEVGLHGGYYSYNNLKEIKREKEKLEKVLSKEVVGYRNHLLRFNVPDTWELLSKAGFKYDTTFGYADMVGFRNGMCHPFRPFNLDTDMEIDILEIPLTIMDCTLFDYMRLDFDKAWDVTKMLIDSVEKHKGIITILWHNTYMVDDKLKFYEKILKYCYEKDAWMTSGEKISEQWSKYKS